jgi:hypothetical protein
MRMYFERGGCVLITQPQAIQQARGVCGGERRRGRGRLLGNRQEPLVTPVPLSPRLLLRCVSGGGSIKIPFFTLKTEDFQIFLCFLTFPDIRRIIILYNPKKLNSTCFESIGKENCAKLQSQGSETL